MSSSSSKNQCSPIFYLYWSIIMPLILGFLGYYIAGIISDYAKTPFATTIVTEPLSAFPTVDLCPEMWFDQRVARNITKHNDLLLAYVLGFSEIEIFNDKISMAKDAFNKANKAGLQAEYESIVNRYGGSYTALIKGIAFNASKLVNVFCKGCAADRKHVIDVVVKENRVCFRVESSKIDYEGLKKSERISLGVAINTKYMEQSFAPDEEGNPGKLTKFNSIIDVVVGNNAFMHYLEDAVPIVATHNYVFYLDTVRVTRLRNCDQQKEASQLKQAIGKCMIDRFVQNCPQATCINYAGLISDSVKGLKLCHQFADSKSYGIASECMGNCFQFCENQSKNPCNQLMTTFIPQQLDKADDGYVDINVYPKNARSTLYVKEFKNFTWNSFVSNVGGLFGISLGASMYSVAEIIYGLIKRIKESWAKERE